MNQQNRMTHQAHDQVVQISRHFNTRGLQPRLAFRPAVSLSLALACVGLWGAALPSAWGQAAADAGSKSVATSAQAAPAAKAALTV